MTKVVKSEDCGNSPKNIFVQDLAIAFARNDTDFLLSKVSDDIRWRIVGQKEIEGKDEFADQIASQNSNDVAKITIHHVVTHGKAGSVNGTRQLEDGSIEEFCDVYEFTNATGKRVAGISSYVIMVTS